MSLVAPPDYAVACLHCAGALAVVAWPEFNSAPWACPACGLGWWPMQLRHGGWSRSLAGYAGQAMWVMAALCEADRLAAAARGCSLLPEQLDWPATPPSALVRLATDPGVSEPFRAQIVAAAARRQRS